MVYFLGKVSILTCLTKFWTPRLPRSSELPVDVENVPLHAPPLLTEATLVMLSPLLFMQVTAVELSSCRRIEMLVFSLAYDWTASVAANNSKQLM